MTLAEQLGMEGHQRGLEQGQLQDARDSVLDILEARFEIAPQDICY